MKWHIKSILCCKQCLRRGCHCVGKCNNRNNKKKLYFDLSIYVIAMLFTHFKKHIPLLVKVKSFIGLYHILKIQSKKKKSPDGEESTSPTKKESIA